MRGRHPDHGFQAELGYTWRALTRSPRVAKKIILLLVVVVAGLLIAKQFAAREH
jgi:hypothetical protein